MEWKKSLLARYTWILQKDAGSIGTADFEKYVLEAQCKELSPNRGAG